MITVASVSTYGQNRQDISNFSQFNQYYNPALTGFDGTSIKNYLRDSWATFDDAPKTLFLSGELNLSDVIKTTSGSLQHGFGLAVLHETFGAFVDNKVNLSYSSTIKISEGVNLRAGVAATYNNIKINDQKLVMDQQGDAAYLALLNGNNSLNKFAVNLGVAVSSDKYYAGYSISDLAKTGDVDQPNLRDAYVMNHIAIAGYRHAINDNFGLVVSGLFQYNEMTKERAEGQVKGVFLNTFWVGAGYRNDIAYTFNTGARFKQFKLNYSRDLTAGKAGGSFRGGNEITLAYNFTPLLSGPNKSLTIW